MGQERIREARPRVDRLNITFDGLLVEAIEAEAGFGRGPGRARAGESAHGAEGLGEDAVFPDR